MLHCIRCSAAIPAAPLTTVMKQPTVQRLTLIVRLRSFQTPGDWCGQVEMVNPHRKAVFRSRNELWRLMETWTARSSTSESECASE